MRRLYFFIGDRGFCGGYKGDSVEIEGDDQWLGDGGYDVLVEWVWVVGFLCEV